MVTLVVEDGSNVADANTYCDLVAVRAYASARGVTLSDDDSVLTAIVVKSMDYIESFRKEFQGNKTNSPGVDGTLIVPQPLQWPRTNVRIDDFDFPVDSIPVELKNSQCQVCIELTAGVDAMPTQVGPFVLREKVGPIETFYSEKIGTGIPEMPKVDALLAPLLKDDAGFALSTIRI
jgi:hypothetical protein